MSSWVLLGGRGLGGAHSPPYTIVTCRGRLTDERSLAKPRAFVQNGKCPVSQEPGLKTLLLSRVKTYKNSLLAPSHMAGFVRPWSPQIRILS